MATLPLSVVIHGHFYQPPREDPWLECVEAQASAAPHHDWNTRITEECYRAVTAARVPGPDGRIARIVNTLEYLSFNFGPTLLEWMEAESPQVYQAVLTADTSSHSRTGGFGNAIAQAYHHTILPLASKREKVSEVRWGIADFQRRFGRDPVGMWLPETAVDSVTLDVLAQEGIAFTILAPHQVEEAPPQGLPGLYRASGGRSLAVFVYDGPLSHGVAFGSLLQDSEKWSQEMAGSSENPSRLLSIATDGETYGHHHRFGEMALAAVLELLERNPKVRIENFASFLSRNPAEHEIALVEPSSWSCSHGVERWRSDCGCRLNSQEKTQQEWRSGLREALEWLASKAHRVFETEGGPIFGDPWAARDGYGPTGTIDSDNPRALELLELERQALRLFTSCAWFFDDLARVEPIQVLRYAARALELIGPNRSEVEEGFLERLESAVSNEKPARTGREIFLQEAKPKVPAPLRVAAGAALWEAITGKPLAEEVRETGKSDSGGPKVPGYRVTKAPGGNLRVTHKKTGREWQVATCIGRPSTGSGAIAVQEVGGEGGQVPLDLKDIPEGFRRPIIAAVSEKIPDPGQALTAAVEELCRLTAPENHSSASGSAPEPTQDQIERIRDLADLQTLLGNPIPFDAQTTFFNFLENAGPEVARRIAPLRRPLGFSPPS